MTTVQSVGLAWFGIVRMKATGVPRVGSSVPATVAFELKFFTYPPQPDCTITWNRMLTR